MALSDSKEAIGAVTELMQTRLASLTKANVVVGRPEAAATANTTGKKLNLFLYRVSFDPQLKNHPLDHGQPAPLWLVLHYLITAFDDGKESDSAAAHRLLGKGLAALQELNFVRPAATDTTLAKNPEPLKITFDDAEPELVSKLMSGSTDHFRVSAAFQVRPVMLAPAAEPAYAPAVKTVGPPGSEGVQVVPSMGTLLESLAPEAFEAGMELLLRGTDLPGNTEVWIGPASFVPAFTPDDSIKVTVPLATTLSAGAYPVTVARVLASGHRMSSNAVLGRLLPTVGGVAVAKPLSSTPGPDRKLFGNFSVSGQRLGGPKDEIYVALYRDGAVRLMLEATGSAAQTSLALTVAEANALTPGAYRLIVRVNGEQAINSPEVDWT